MQLGLKKFRILRHIPIHLLLVAASLVMVIPFIWMITTSFKLEKDIFVVPPKFFGIDYTLSNYGWLFSRMPFFLYMFNTLKVTALVVTGQLFTSALAGYAFARLQFRVREPLFMLYLATMMVPSFVTLVPSFVIFRTIGLMDTHAALILPGLATAFGTFLMRQFFLSIPDELEQAAKIDGCSPFGIFYRIFVPLCKPALTTLGIFIFNGVWNDYLAPLIYIVSPSKKTLTVAIASLQGTYATNWGLLMSGLTISILPVLIAFLCAQDVFVKGIALTGLKA